MFDSISHFRKCSEEWILKSSEVKGDLISGATGAVLGGVVGFAAVFSVEGMPTSLFDVLFLCFGITVMSVLGFVWGWFLWNLVLGVLYITISIIMPRSIRVFVVAIGCALLGSFIRFRGGTWGDTLLRFVVYYCVYAVVATIIDTILVKFTKHGERME